MSYVIADQDAAGVITNPVAQDFSNAGILSDTTDTIMNVAIKSPETGKIHLATRKGVLGTSAVAAFAPLLMPKVTNSVLKTLGLKQRVASA